MSTLNLKEIKNPNAPSGIQLLNDGGVVLPGSLTSTITGGGGSISGDRNRVINGSCQIVNVASVANNGTPVVQFGGPELFKTVNNGGGGQFTQSQGSVTFQGLSLPTVRQTVNAAIASTAASNTWIGVHHEIEGFNAFDLRGKPVVLSFIFNTNVTGVYSVSLRDGTPSQSYVTTFSATANTPVEIKIAIPTIPTAASIPNNNTSALTIVIGALNTGTFQTATLNTWQSGNFFTATGATNWGATVGNFIELTRLQLEEGTVATPFVWRPYGQELALTQRYYEQSYDLGVAANTVTTNGAIHIGTVSAEGGGPSFHTLQFKVPKRTTPSLIFYNVNGGVGTWTYRRAGVANTSISVSAVAGFSNSFSTLIQSGDVGAAYAAVILQGHFTASARL